jgi:hypothetical protein
MNALGATIAFSPLVGWLILYVLAGIAVATVAGGLFLRARGVAWRTGAVAIL